MKKLKSLLLNLLGQRGYLTLTSRLFFLYFENGWLRDNPSYTTHYFVKNLIQPGYTVLDIGANLGYYSVQFAQLVGDAGKVYSVEPIELYRNILTKNVSEFSQVEILPFALGEQEGMIKMGNPSIDKHRHGLMRVLNENEQESDKNVYEVAMKNPAQLFSGIGRIDYIKCDIEGYEVPVIPLMRELIQTQQPLIQIETDGENKQILFDMFTELQYQIFYVQEDKLQAYHNASLPLPGDMIGIPAGRVPSLQHLIAGG